MPKGVCLTDCEKVEWAVERRARRTPSANRPRVPRVWRVFQSSYTELPITFLKQNDTLLIVKNMLNMEMSSFLRSVYQNLRNTRRSIVLWNAIGKQASENCSIWQHAPTVNSLSYQCRFSPFKMRFIYHNVYYICAKGRLSSWLWKDWMSRGAACDVAHLIANKLCVFQSG